MRIVDRLYLELARRTKPTASSQASAPLEVINIVGLPKSGKSLLASTLRSHGLDVFPYEGNDLIFGPLYPFSESEIDAPPMWAEPAAVVSIALSRHGGENWGPARLHCVLRSYARLTGASSIFFDNGNLFEMPGLQKLAFGEFHRQVLVMRHPVIVVTQIATRLSGKIAASPKYEASGFNLSYSELVDHFAVVWAKAARRATEPEPVPMIRYEDLCSSPKAALASLGVRPVGVESSSSHALVNMDAQRLAAIDDTHAGRIMSLVGSSARDIGYA